MNNPLSSPRHFVRLVKNDIIHRYYSFRINGTQSPYRILFKKDAYKVLFILSHMRSGSSLLTHILSSNPAIKGYGETHIQYESELDLRRLMFKIYFHSQEFKNFQDLRKLNMDHIYILDKILHDHKLLNENLLELENFYFIFLIREPKRSLISMLDHKPHWTEQDALQYYRQRLSTLARYAHIINNKNRSLLLTYDQLINNTDSVFSALQNFLKTPEGFSETYQVSNTTGMRHVGDFKEKIRSGKIVRKHRKIDLDISQESLAQATDCFEKYELDLFQSCTII